MSRRRSRREPKALKLKKRSKSRGRIVDMFELRAAVPLVRRGNDVPPEPTPSEQRRAQHRAGHEAAGGGAEMGRDPSQAGLAQSEHGGIRFVRLRKDQAHLTRRAETE